MGEPADGAGLARFKGVGGREKQGAENKES